MNAKKLIVGCDCTSTGLAYLRLIFEIKLTNGSKTMLYFDTDCSHSVVYCDINDGKAYAIGTKVGTGVTDSGYKGDAYLVFSESCRQQTQMCEAITSVSFDFYNEEGTKCDPSFEFGGVVPGSTVMLFSGVSL